jgi:hypothetical protein
MTNGKERYMAKNGKCPGIGHAQFDGTSIV